MAPSTTQAESPAEERVRVRVLTRRGRRRKIKRALMVVAAAICVLGAVYMTMTMVPRFLSGLAEPSGGGDRPSDAGG